MSTQKHKLIPKHTLLTSEEKKTLLEKLHITIKELPKIKITDASIQSFEPSSGDIIKITRQSRSAGVSIYYRVVVE